MPISFATERTLGRLGKWLRIMGFDTILETEYPRGTFTRQLGGDRIFLTRTRRALQTHAALKPVLVVANDPFEQLVAVIRQAPIRPEEVRALSRCLRCNETIVSVSKNAVQGVVPDYIWEVHASFSQCPRCRRVYWRGSHTYRSLEIVDNAFRHARV
jgi:uncharacterized protein with PIN domain